MTDGVGQIGHALGRRSVSSVAVLAAGSLLAALALSACGTDVAKADTVLRSARAATLQLADGSSRPADEGMTVPKGATVTTAPGGSASLATAGRVVLLGGDTAVTVFDGRREALRKGLVMIDARRAGDLDLDAGAATVSAGRGALTRVERAALLRVASYRKGSSVRATGRRATVAVTELHQVQVPYGGLPGRVTALGLTLDAWERRYALDLVTSDEALRALASGLASGPVASAVVQALPASFGTRTTPPTAEDTVGVLISRAARRGGSAQDKLEDVRRYRAEGGSWGVVAALVDADAAAVAAALDAILSPREQVLAADPDDLPFGPGVVPAGDDTSADEDGSGPSATPRPSTGPRPTSSASPRPSRSPDPVDDVVTAVESLLPTPLPKAPAPSQSPVLQLDVAGVTVGVG